jgi:hypothetical protein
MSHLGPEHIATVRDDSYPLSAVFSSEKAQRDTTIVMSWEGIV